MKTQVNRRTVDLSGFPDLVVIYLGMRVNSWRGLKTLLKFGPKIAAAVEEKPEGLLLHENFVFSLFPPHAGMRQYWRDFEALETWARTRTHLSWWQEFIRDTGGTGFWHESYFMRGGMEAIYDNVPGQLGFLAFAPAQEARGSMFSARTRVRREGQEAVPEPIPESDVYR